MIITRFISSYIPHTPMRWGMEVYDLFTLVYLKSIKVWYHDV
nr:MAG TPA: hypothetical protein [Caudoviricetes sp.]